MRQRTRAGGLGFAGPGHRAASQKSQLHATGVLYEGYLFDSGRANINRTATARLRLYLDVDSDRDARDDCMAVYSGNADTANQPALIVYYNP